MNTKNLFFKSLGMVTLIGVSFLTLGSVFTPVTQAHAADAVLVSVAITASPTTICTGQSALITWSSTDATSISIDQGIGSVLPYGSRYVSPNQTTTYRITGTNSTGGFGTATATVYVSGPCSTPTPTPTPTPTITPTPTPFLSCSPEFQTVLSGQYANFVATGAGGPSTYSWYASSGSPSSATGSSFSTRFFADYIDQTRYVTVTSGNQSQNCIVRVLATNVTPTPTPSPTLTISKTVRNVTTGSNEVDNVSASPNDTLEFSIRINSGSSTVSNIRVSDSLPSQLSYVSGSTTINGSYYGDGVVSGGINIGTYGSYQTVTLRFRANVNGAGSFNTGTTNLTNYGYASADNLGTISDTASVSVNKTQADTNFALSITKYGRNITLGQAAEQSSVRVLNGNTVEFIIRVRSLSNSNLYNVIVTDLLPAGIEYLPRTTGVNNTIVDDSIMNGLNIGSLAPGQESIIRFSGRINALLSFPSGSLVAYNTAQVRADNVSTVSAQLPLTLGTVAGVSTGPTESLFLALGLSVLVTALYAAYTRTGLFQTRLASATARRHQEDGLNFHRFV